MRNGLLRHFKKIKINRSIWFKSRKMKKSSNNFRRDFLFLRKVQHLISLLSHLLTGDKRKN